MYYININYLPGICSLNLDETEFHAPIIELQPSDANPAQNKYLLNKLDKYLFL